MSEALGESLGERLELGRELKGLVKNSGGWRLEFEGKSVEAKQVVLALPAYITADLIESFDSKAAAAFRDIHYPPLSVVQSAFPRTATKHPLNGFGALHNHLEPTETLGTIFSSTTFPGRCPADEVMLTSFIGGARHPDKAAQSDSQLLAAATADYQRFLGLSGQPAFSKIIRWPHAIPQYDHRILPARQHEKQWATDGLHLAGNWTHGISVPSCLEKAQSLCEQLGN